MEQRVSRLEGKLEILLWVSALVVPLLIAGSAWIVTSSVERSEIRTSNEMKAIEVRLSETLREIKQDIRDLRNSNIAPPGIQQPASTK